MIDFAKIIKGERKRQKKSVPALAREAEINQQTLYNFENPKNKRSEKTTLRFLEKVLTALGAEIVFKK